MTDIQPVIALPGTPESYAGNAALRRQAEKKTSHWWLNRDTVEQVIIMAVVLAFMFRTFLLEAFVIPTGSMAPTLMGRHLDLVCPECGIRFEVGASSEEPRDPSDSAKTVILAVCSNCRHVQQLDPRGDYRHRSYSGDKILVSKFSYDLQEPKRWDVIVFKFPHRARDNYIKRLIGLPGETISICNGDVYVRDDASGRWQIQRKPPKRILAMLQLVHDTEYSPELLYQAGFPLRWEGDAATDAGGWTGSDDGREYRCRAAGDRVVWLRYRHRIPTMDDWLRAKDGAKVESRLRRGRLITDFYAYNARIPIDQEAVFSGRYRPDEVLDVQPATSGLFWVGDLAVECQVEVRSNTGAVWLDLVEGGRHHRCRIDVETGRAELWLAGPDGRPDLRLGEGENKKVRVAGKTTLRGKGRYRIRFANIDNQLTLWVDRRVVAFDGPTVYESDAERERPYWSSSDPGDLAPVGIGSERAELKVTRLRVLRDIHYVATHDSREWWYEYLDGIQSRDDLDELAASPEMWSSSPLFDRRNRIVFELKNDWFFPMGDNSPESADARSWGKGGSYVERRLLIGKALVVFWPHPVGRPVFEFVPNVKRMRWIR